MIDSFKLLINAFMFKIENSIKDSVADWNQEDSSSVSYIKNKPGVATDEDVFEMLAELDVLPTVIDADGNILTDENGNILIW